MYTKVQFGGCDGATKCESPRSQNSVGEVDVEQSKFLGLWATIRDG